MKGRVHAGMRFPIRLLLSAFAALILTIAPVPPALAADDNPSATPALPAHFVVDFIDDIHDIDDSGRPGHGHPSGHGAAQRAAGHDRAAANERAAEILADLRNDRPPRQSTSSESPGSPASTGFNGAALEAGGQAATAGLTVVYDSSNPPPAIAKTAIEESVAVWDAKLDTRGMPVVVEVSWVSFNNPGVLGFAGPNGLISRTNLPTGYLYPMPLANVLAGTDHNGSAPEIRVVLNKDLESSGKWHYGTGTPSSGRIDLRTVVAHEVGHGVGFVSSASTDSGSLDFYSPPAIYDAQTLYQGNPIVGGGQVATALTSNNAYIKISATDTRALYSPSTWSEGSSFSHFVTSSGSLMAPSLQAGTTNRAVDGATAGVMAMIGWPQKVVSTGPPTVTERPLDGQIKRVYLAHLQRNPDTAGFNFWTGQRASGLPLLSMIADFQSSAEFVRTYGSLSNSEFVTLIYNNVLGRNPDSAGLSHWTSLLDAGVSRAEVSEGFIESAEFVRITGTDAPYSSSEGAVRRLYLAFFGREGSTADVDYWTGQTQAGTPLISVADLFATSTEFTNRYGPLTDSQFVSLVYQNVLGRTADSSGFAFWMAQLDAGMSRGEMMLEFSQGAEFIRTTSTIP